MNNPFSYTLNADLPDNPERTINLKDEERGLYNKYVVSRVGDPTGKHSRCQYFVLDLNHDKHARLALHAYIDSCRQEYPELAKDLSDLVAKYFYGADGK